MTVKAIYRQGTFIPQEPCSLPEESLVELVVRTPRVGKPAVDDPVERMRILKQVTERMRGNVLPLPAPELTRDALHARS